MKGVPSDEERIDPARARRWWVSHGWSFTTIVVATGEDEARAVAAAWFAKKSGKTHMAVPTRGAYRVKEADDVAAEKFLALLAQDRGGVAQLKSSDT